MLFFAATGQLSILLHIWLIYCIIIVRNVPCDECTDCGEKYFTDDVMARLEEIVKRVRKIASEVFVTNYTKQAA